MQPALFAWSSSRSHPPKAVWTLQLRLHEEQKWEVTCRWTEYSVLWTSDAGFTSAAFRKWLWVYRFNVGDVCRRSVQINLFGGCHFIETESHKPAEETNPVLGCLFANDFWLILLASLTCYTPTGGKFVGYTEQAEMLPHCKILP